MRRTVELLIHEWLGAATLCARPRYADHSTDTFRAVLDTCERIAAEEFAPLNRQADLEEPRMVDDRVVLPAGARATAKAYVDSGMLAAAQDYAMGGMQLPCVVEMAANAFFAKAGIALGGGNLLTVGNANLLMAHGTAAQKKVFARQEFSGRWFGTMCLSEPQAGSSLSDIITRAVPDGATALQDPLGARYRLYGNKMWITNGDHDLTENIVHLVLAKIPGEGGALIPGIRGISLFLAPKHLVDTQGNLTGERNDIALAGLNHKLGYRGFPNTLLNFGEGRYPVRGAAGAIGYLVGQPGRGLEYMFHMMNEARIGVGLGATAIGYAGYEASLEYARNRRQGRALGRDGKDPAALPLRIIEHGDVKRMLLAQKAYVEGALALELYCARLVDDVRTGDQGSAAAAASLLEVLTPIAKSWPSEWCLEANSLAIQVHGGCGYTRDFPVEQYWRDNRLNMIHEGAHGIHGIDLLGRKVRMAGGAAFALLLETARNTRRRATEFPPLTVYAGDLGRALDRLEATTREAWETPDPNEALANATPYLQGFGHVVIAWMWLDVAIVAVRERASSSERNARIDHLDGLLQSARYFYEYELPKIDAWLSVAASRNSTCREMREEWF
jgi:alkylation response protein AidB-like acyl-CoA dehydrogenase